MDGIAIKLSDLLGGMRKDENEHAKPRPLHEAQIMELRELLKREQRPNPFKVGDLVTPRKDGRYVGAGEPFIIIEVLDQPALIGIYEKEDVSSAGTYEHYDVRVGGLSQGGMYCVWLQRSQELEFYPSEAAGASKDAAGWITWGGGERPVDAEAIVEITFADGDSDVGCAGLWSWSHDNADGDIVRYRIVP